MLHESPLVPAVDHAVGVSDIAKIGARVTKGEPLARLHANAASGLQDAVALIDDAFSISDGVPNMPPLIVETILPDA